MARRCRITLDVRAKFSVSAIGGPVKTIKKAVQSFPRVPCALLPTPVHKLDRLSSELGISLHVKRDDMTGLAFGGNKARKLEYLLGEARARDAKVLIAVGSCQSNFCRMVAALGKIHDFEVHLVLGGAKPTFISGNLLVDRMVGATCHFVESHDWNDWLQESEKLTNWCIQKGKSVYAMPVGGSTPLGCMGYVQALGEIADDEKRLKTKFDRIYLASGSGGTQAGLIVAQAIAQWPGSIVGISVAQDGGAQRSVVSELVGETAGLLGVHLLDEEIIVDGDYLGEGYGIPSVEGDKAVELFANKESVFLDSVYTGKAAAAVIGHVKSGEIKAGEKILFLHTGGSVSLFA